MTLTVTIGSTKFKLVVSSSDHNESVVSTKFIPQKSSDSLKKSCNERDAIIELSSFTGKLYISHPDNEHNETSKENHEFPRVPEQTLETFTNDQNNHQSEKIKKLHINGVTHCERNLTRHRSGLLENFISSNKVNKQSSIHGIPEEEPSFHDEPVNNNDSSKWEKIDRNYFVDGVKWFGRVHKMKNQTDNVSDISSEICFNSKEVTNSTKPKQQQEQPNKINRKNELRSDLAVLDKEVENEELLKENTNEYSNSTLLLDNSFSEENDIEPNTETNFIAHYDGMAPRRNQSISERKNQRRSTILMKNTSATSNLNLAGLDIAEIDVDSDINSDHEAEIETQEDISKERNSSSEPTTYATRRRTAVMKNTTTPSAQILPQQIPHDNNFGNYSDISSIHNFHSSQIFHNSTALVESQISFMKDDDMSALPSVKTEDKSITEHLTTASIAKTVGDATTSEDDDDGSYLSLANRSTTVRRRANRAQTKLHVLCQSPKVKTKDLRKALKANPTDASIYDVDGKLPLHIIVCNEYFLFGRYADSAVSFIDLLIKAYPEAILTPDDNGHIPLTASIADWIDDVHHSTKEPDPNTPFFIKDKNYPEELLIPTVVYADPLVEWSFKMLSQVFNRLHSSSSQKINFTSVTRLYSPAQEFLEKISTIPLLFKTCLLINNDSLRYRIFSMPYIKRCFLNPHIVGNWLVVLLADDSTSARAIEFFEGLSNLSTSAGLGIHDKPKITDVKRFRELQEEVILQISEMDYILAALYTLDENKLKRACKTYAVQRVLEICMTNPSLLGLLVFDLITHLLLLCSFHVQTRILIHWRENLLKNNIYPTIIQILFDSPIILTSTICIYLLIREDLWNFLVLFKINSPRTVSSWNVIELLTVFSILATNLISIISGPTLPVWVFICAKTLTYLRLLTFLKRVNLHLSIFVQSLGKILNSMFYFLMVFFLCIFLMGDIIHLIFYASGWCEGIDVSIEKDLIGDYCSPDVPRNWIRSYAIIVGDVELDAYRASALVTMIWCLFTFVGVIILLNLLVAIVNSTYNKSFSNRYTLLGRERVPLLARHAELERSVRQFLEHRKTTNSITKFKFYFTFAVIFVFVLVFLFSFFILVRISTSHGSISILGYIYIVFVLVLFLIANIALFIVIIDILNVKLWGGCEKYAFTMRFVHILKKVIFKFLGIDKSNKNDLKDDLEEKNIIPEIKDIVELSENRICSELRKRKTR